jgi:hypothetical protein
MNNSKALKILKACSQLKQIKIALGLYQHLLANNIIIGKEVYNELVNVCLTCSDLNSASLIFNDMDQNKIQADKEYLDKFVLLYTKNMENLKNFEGNGE